jgi:hypothetical protein
VAGARSLAVVCKVRPVGARDGAHRRRGAEARDGDRTSVPDPSSRRISLAGRPHCRERPRRPSLRTTSSLVPSRRHSRRRQPIRWRASCSISPHGRPAESSRSSSAHRPQDPLARAECSTNSVTWPKLTCINADQSTEDPIRPEGSETPSAAGGRVFRGKLIFNFPFSTNKATVRSYET